MAILAMPEHGRDARGTSATLDSLALCFVQREEGTLERSKVPQLSGRVYWTSWIVGRSELRRGVFR